MNTILLIIQKEFLQIFRNRTILPIIFIVPLVQMLVLVFAATFEMKNIKMVIVDNDLSPISRKLISKFTASPFYIIKEQTCNIKYAQSLMFRDQADVILQIPQDFEKKLYKQNTGKVQLLINSINNAAAGLINAYSNYIINDFNKSLMVENSNVSQSINQTQIVITNSFWYNPDMNYKIFMLPGILVILVTLIGMLLSSFNFVLEKELGTIEQINVTPIRKYQFVIGKLLPFWIIALFELAFGLTIGKLLFDIPFRGSLFLLFGFASLYLLAVMGIGLFISTVSYTQQQVMFVAFFFMITFLLMSGIFTPVESMPYWAQKINIINPLAYFMKVIRMILLKGSGFKDIINEFISLAIYAFIIILLSIWRYKKII